MNWIDRDGKFLVSYKEEFYLGFVKTPKDITLFLLAVVHMDSSKMVWVANRGNPISNSDKFVFDEKGNASLHKGGTVVWSTNTSGRGVSSMELQDNGNLVLLGNDSIVIWQSFSHPTDTMRTQLSEDQNKQRKGNENSVDEKDDASNLLPPTESYSSMGEILSSMDPGNHLPVPGIESGSGKQTGIASSSSFGSKRSTLWGRSNPRKTPSVELVDSSGEEELAIQRLEIAKSDLQHRITKEARDNAILQASLERRKQALHERHLEFEQDVSRLQEQLQAERDLRAALEVGLSKSSGQFSSSRGMDSKTKAELEEIALIEADVARLKQKVAELHHKLNQQRQHHYG